MKNLLVVVMILAFCALGTAAPHKPDISAVKKASAADRPSHFFQLQAQSNNLCLSLTPTEGIYVPCTNQTPTVFFLSSDPPRPGAESIVMFGTPSCLDREHCHSSSSNLRSSDCGHCGAIHWDIRSDGSVREDDGKNCIYSVSNTTAAIRHCQDGFEHFRVLPIGDRFYMKSINHGDCVSTGTFVNCSQAPSYYITGTPFFYNIRVYNEPNTCLDREHCHFSTSNLRFSDCSHCGAIHWAIMGTAVGEDNMQNCINRDGLAQAVVEHCSDHHEGLQYEFLPPLPNEALQNREKVSTATKHFPNPNISNYLTLDLAQRCRGIKILRNSQDNSTEIEIVHFLPDDRTFSVEQYFIQYMITHIHTSTPYKNWYNSRSVLKGLFTDPSQVTAIDFCYGGVRGPAHNNYDGLFSEFLTNAGLGETLPRKYYPKVVSEIYIGFQSAIDNWNLYRDSVYVGFGSNASPQIYLSILPPGYYSALYWSNYDKNLRMDKNHV